MTRKRDNAPIQRFRHNISVLRTDRRTGRKCTVNQCRAQRANEAFNVGNCNCLVYEGSDLPSCKKETFLEQILARCASWRHRGRDSYGRQRVSNPDSLYSINLRYESWLLFTVKPVGINNFTSVIDYF